MCVCVCVCVHTCVPTRGLRCLLRFFLSPSLVARLRLRRALACAASAALRACRRLRSYRWLLQSTKKRKKRHTECRRPWQLHEGSAHARCLWPASSCRLFPYGTSPAVFASSRAAMSASRMSPHACAPCRPRAAPSSSSRCPPLAVHGSCETRHLQLWAADCTSTLHPFLSSTIYLPPASRHVWRPHPAPAQPTAAHTWNRDVVPPSSAQILAVVAHAFPVFFF